MDSGKSLIDIYNSDGNIVTMELICSFSANNINYIIYKELDSEKMYAAKFKNSVNEDFDANLTSDELELVNKIYKEMQNDNK